MNKDLFDACVACGNAYRVPRTVENIGGKVRILDEFGDPVVKMVGYSSDKSADADFIAKACKYVFDKWADKSSDFFDNQNNREG